MTNYIGNHLSLGMLDFLQESDANITAKLLSLSEAKVLVTDLDFQSCLGHADTALLVSSLLGKEFKMNRVSTSLLPGDMLLVAQYNGPRLEEGAISLPEGAKIRWILSSIFRFSKP